MAKISLNDIANFQNDATATSTFNANNVLVETAFENTLSRDGTSPNMMNADLDMNSNQILNLPDATLDTEPVTFGQFNDGISDLGDLATTAAAIAANAASASSSATSSAFSASTAATSATSAATSATAAANASAAVAFKYTWSTDTTSTDPTTGKIKVNNAAPGSATALYISETDANANNLATEIARWDDATAAAGKARVKIAKNATNFLLTTITSVVTDNGTWDTFTVGSSALTGSFSNGDTVYVEVQVNGADGAGTGDVVGPASSTDKAVVRFNGATGKLVQNSAVTIADTTGLIAGARFANTGLNIEDTDASHLLNIKPGTNITANRTLTLTTGDVDRTVTISGATTISQDYSTTGNPQFATIELGAASDTTISRDSAGVIAVEGVALSANIPQNSKSAAYTTVLSDAQKHIFHPSADTTARTWTIDSNANVAYPIGTAITFVNQVSGGIITIAITSDTMRLAGPGTTGSRSLAANGIATALKIATTEWIISGTGLT